MTVPKRYYHKQEKAKRRQLKNCRRELSKKQAEAQKYIQDLERACNEIGLPEEVAKLIACKLKTQRKLLAKIFAMMFPPFFACTNYYELCRVLCWNKNLPTQILGKLPKKKWLELVSELGQDVLELVWKHTQDKSPATQSRWQLTFIVDDSLFKKYRSGLRLVGKFWSGQEKHPTLGIDGLALLVVVGDGKMIIPMDFMIRRPDPRGQGHPCYNKFDLLRIMIARTWPELQARGLHLTSSLMVADSWFGDSTLLDDLLATYHITMIVEGKSAYVFYSPDGTRIKGKDLLTSDDWPWRVSPQVPGTNYVRLFLTSPTFGSVTVTIVDKPGQDRFYLLCPETKISSPRLIRTFGKRFWVEWCFRSLKSLLVIDVCQIHTENNYYGHFFLRLMALTVLTYTARIILKRKVTMEKIINTLKHYWRFVDSELFELQALSWDMPLEVA